jgi:hypothetical protein
MEPSSKKKNEQFAKILENQTQFKHKITLKLSSDLSIL